MIYGGIDVKEKDAADRCHLSMANAGSQGLDDCFCSKHAPNHWKPVENSSEHGEDFEVDEDENHQPMQPTASSSPVLSSSVSSSSSLGVPLPSTSMLSAKECESVCETCLHYINQSTDSLNELKAQLRNIAGKMENDFASKEIGYDVGTSDRKE